MRKVFLSVFALFLAVLIASCGPAADENVMCTVTFIVGNGEDPITREVAVGTPIDEPMVSIEGLILAGWYRDQELTEEWDFTTPVNSDIVLYAYWESVPIEYCTATYRDYSGEVFSERTVLKDSLIPNLPVNEHRDGFVFLGWYEDGADEPFDFNIPIQSDITLTQRWASVDDVETCTVTLYIDGELYDEYEVAKGFRLVGPEYGERDGYRFSGWYTDPELSQPLGYDSIAEQDISLYGEWEQIPKPSDSGFYYTEKNDGTLTITGLVDEDAAGTELYVPSLIDGKTVSAIGEGAFMMTDFSSVIIEDGISEIGAEAFFWVESLTSVDIPSSVRIIGNSAFDLCSNLKEFTIPYGTEIIEDYAFDDTAIETLVIPDSVRIIGARAFGDYIVHLELGDGIESIGEFAFEQSDITYLDTGNAIDSLDYFKTNRLETLIMGDGFTVFEGLVSDSSIQYIEFGKNVERIAEWALSMCETIEEITIPSNVKEIGRNAFSGCSNLSTIELNEGLQSIGDYAFGGTGISSIVIPESVVSIGTGVFKDCENLTSVDLGKTQSIGDEAFYGCGSLEYIEIPESVRTLGDDTFSYCTNLSEVVLKHGVESIGDSTFEESGLQSIVIPESVISIGSAAFKNCYSLKSAEITGSVITIGDMAFQNCTSLSEVKFGEWLETIGNNAFEDTAIESIVIPERVTSIGRAAFHGCNNLTEAIINAQITSLDAFEFRFNTNLRSFEMSSTIESIPAGMFWGCSALSNVVINSGKIAIIDDNTFNECSALESIVLPYALEEIGDSAFGGCTKLRSISIPDLVKSIGNDAFDSCLSLSIVTLSEELESIGDAAFLGCPFTTIEIPGTVTTIGKDAFSACTSLHSIYLDISGTELPIGFDEEWLGNSNPKVFNSNMEEIQIV